MNYLRPVGAKPVSNRPYSRRTGDTSLIMKLWPRWQWAQSVIQQKILEDYRPYFFENRPITSARNNSGQQSSGELSAGKPADGKLPGVFLEVAPERGQLLAGHALVGRWSAAFTDGRVGPMPLVATGTAPNRSLPLPVTCTAAPGPRIYSRSAGIRRRIRVLRIPVAPFGFFQPPTPRVMKLSGGAIRKRDHAQAYSISRQCSQRRSGRFCT